MQTQVRALVRRGRGEEDDELSEVFLPTQQGEKQSKQGSRGPGARRRTSGARGLYSLPLTEDSLPGQSNLCKIHQRIEKPYRGTRKMDKPWCLRSPSLRSRHQVVRFSILRQKGEKYGEALRSGDSQQKNKLNVSWARDTFEVKRSLFFPFQAQPVSQS